MTDLVVNHQNALAILEQQDTPEAKAIIDYVQMIESKNIAVLGTDEAFVMRDKGGEIKAFKSVITLSQKNGTLVQPVYNGDLVVSAQGYEVMSKAAGVSTVYPKNIIVNGVTQNNPYPVRSGGKENGRIIEVHCCAVTFGYSPLGIPQASARTTVFDTPAYRMVDLLAKAKKFPQAFMVLPVDMKPNDLKEGENKASKRETWTHYPYDEAMNLWMNTSHNEVISWLSQIVKREMKSFEFAQTFAARNSQKHYFGIQKVPCDNYQIPVIAWRPTGNNIIKWDSAQYSDLQDRVSVMIDGDKNNEFQQKIELDQGFERVSDEEGFEVLEAKAEPEDAQESGRQSIAQEENQTENKQDDQPSEPSKNVMQAIYLAKTFPSEFEEACRICKIPLTLEVKNYSDKTAVSFCQQVAELVDKQN